MLLPAVPTLAPVAVTVTVATLEEAVTFTLLPFPARFIVATRLDAWVVVFALLIMFVPVLGLSTAVKVRVVTPFVIVIVSPTAGSPAKVPVSLAARAVVEPARLVL